MTVKLMIANGAIPAVGAAALVDHWVAVHAPLVIEHLAPKRYTLTTFRDPGVGFAAMASLYFDDDAVPVGLPDPIAKDPFYTMIDQRLSLRTVEHVIVDGPSEGHGIKMTVLVRRRPGVTAEDFYGHWLDVHGPNMAEHLRATPGGLRYAVSFAHDEPDDAEVHGVAEVWYRDTAAAKAHTAALTDDGFGRYASAKDMRYLSGTEQVLVGPN